MNALKPRANNKPLRVCCYARVDNLAFFETHEFYRVDIELFKELGFEVQVTNSIATLAAAECDLYFAWWFGYGFIPTLLGKLRRRPVIVSGVIHTLDCGGLRQWPFAKRMIMQWTMLLSDCSIFCSPCEQTRLEAFAPRRLEIIPLAVDEGIYGPSGVAKDKLVVLITQLNLENVQRKMVLEAVDAFALFHASNPGYQLVIAGAKGNGEALVRDTIARHGLEQVVTLAGRISLQDKVLLLQRAAIYLQPTSCEAFGLAIGEALACGTPVVSTPEVCVRETYEDAVTYGKDPAEIAACLGRLASDERYYQAQQSVGLAKVALYSRKLRKSRLEAVLASLV
jgi:glycosyltransferase involved in cell wall biosynthesis